MAGGEGPRLAGKVLLWLFPCLHWEQDESPWCWCPAYRSFLGFLMGTLTGMPWKKDFKASIIRNK